jgi:hypothetical protein
MTLTAALAMTIARAAPEAAGPPPPKAATRSGAAKAAKPPSHPVLKQLAPEFQLPDTEKKLRKLSEFRGRPVALFFFCGCSWCADVAREWAALQRGGALPAGRRGGPVTVVVYAGLDAEAARNLAAAAGLDPARTVLLPDPDSHVSARRYQVDPCPRAFVVDAAGVLRYTNQGADEAPRVAPGLVIASRTRDALQAAAPASSGTRK